MRVVVVLALAGLVALLIAIFTDSPAVATPAIALAAIGILLLVRDWRADRRGHEKSGVDQAPADHGDPEITVPARMDPDTFAPDISVDGIGPSSDARAD